MIEGASKFCRLRQNHVHFWNRNGVNPIPKDCEYRWYYTSCNKIVCSEWHDSTKSTINNWSCVNTERGIVSFKIRYK